MGFTRLLVLGCAEGEIHTSPRAAPWEAVVFEFFEP